MTSPESALLLKIITTVAGFATTPIKNKLERNKTVIKLLKKLGFQPDHPPTDFSGVYAYTLVEYGIGKPQPVLELFQQDEIRQAFREAFEQSDASILIEKGQDFIDAYALGDQIKEIGIKPLQEFVTFATHFLDVTLRTRTPAEVVTHQKLDSLQRSFTDIQDQVARAQKPQEVLLEFALQAQNYQAFQPANDSSVGKVKKFILAQQMRSWFTALKYGIESYEVEGETYKEILLVYREEDDSVRWRTTIKSVFILNRKKENDLLHLLTIEGKSFSIELKTGVILPTQENNCLRTWLNADLEGVTGLLERDIHILKVLGAINLPETYYDPHIDDDFSQVFSVDEEDYEHEEKD